MCHEAETASPPQAAAGLCRILSLPSFVQADNNRSRCQRISAGTTQLAAEHESMHAAPLLAKFLWQ